MNPLDSLEIKLCQLQAKIFEASVKGTTYSSPIFIRRFMNSSVSKSFDENKYLFLSSSINDVFDTLDDEFGKSSYGTIKYSEDQMFWIGYIYRCISIKYNLTSKVVFEFFNSKNIIKYYNIGHTFDIVQAAEWMIENINYNNNIEEKSLNIMRRLMMIDKAKELIGKNVIVYIDRPIGYSHNGILYTQNYGYIKDFKALDGKYQDAYVIGVDESLDIFEGKVIAVVNRKDDIEDKLIVCEKNKNYTNEKINNLINFQKKYFKHKILR